MLSSLISGSFDVQSFLIQLLLSIPIVFLSLSVHETAHGFVAYKLGDPTAHSLGRLSLNPLKHLDPLGFLSMVLFGYGWAKPVPINTRYFKKPKRDMALTALAGPLSNLLLALLFALLLRLAAVFMPNIAFRSEFWFNVYTWLWNFLYLGIYLNVSLTIFNLIPIPPFDGSRLAFTFLPTHLYFKIMRYEQYIYIGLLLALFLGILDIPLDWLTNHLMNLIFRIIF